MESKYIIDPDFDVYQAGFQLRSKLDEKREALEKELSRYSNKRTGVTLLLTFFPIMGLHRMFNGKFFSGLLFACTAGGLFIWWIADMIKIVSGHFRDGEGKIINSAEAVALEMEIESLASHYSTESYVYKAKKEARYYAEKAEYLTICEELGYDE